MTNKLKEWRKAVGNEKSMEKVLTDLNRSVSMEGMEKLFKNLKKTEKSITVGTEVKLNSLLYRWDFSFYKFIETIKRAMTSDDVEKAMTSRHDVEMTIYDIEGEHCLNKEHKEDLINVLKQIESRLFDRTCVLFNSKGK